MTDATDAIRDERALDERLSRPGPALIDFMRRLDGDILVLGASGKVGPTLARMAHRAIQQAGVTRRVIAVARSGLEALSAEGIETRRCDLLDRSALEALPRPANVVYLVGRKFGSTGQESQTWATNVLAAAQAAEVFADSRIVAFSTGCVYPLCDVRAGGATEATPPAPVGEYAMSCLGRERVFEHASLTRGTRAVQIRLNYAVELRYGVLADLARRIYQHEAIDVTTGHANVIWQGDACDYALRALELAASPQALLNVTGPETFSVRHVAQRLGELLERPVRFTGQENGWGYLNDASRAHGLFGYPSVPLETLLAWTARWVRQGGPTLDKPTHFEVQDGKY